MTRIYCERLRAQRDELVAALKSCSCPGGGWTGMPRDMEATVEACVVNNVCGCTLGAAIAKAGGILMTQIYILFRNEKYYVVLRHQDGSEEISDQSFATREECENAIEQYVKDRKVQLMRPQ